MALDVAEKQQAFLGLRVLTLAQRRGLSIPQLAKAARLPLSTVQKIVAGDSKQPSAWTIWALAVVLETSTDFLLQLTDEPVQYPLKGSVEKERKEKP